MCSHYYAIYLKKKYITAARPLTIIYYINSSYGTKSLVITAAITDMYYTIFTNIIDAQAMTIPFLPAESKCGVVIPQHPNLPAIYLKNNNTLIPARPKAPNDMKNAILERFYIYYA